MKDRTRDPAYALHAVVFLLDRAADDILPALDLTYSRFLALLTIERLGGATQRAVADALGVTEPSASRTIRRLQEDGLVDSSAMPGVGNRRTVSLTDKGDRVVDEAAARLERSFADLLKEAGLRPAQVVDVTDPLLATLAKGAS